MQKYLPGHKEKLRQPWRGMNLPHALTHHQCEGRNTEGREGSCSICTGNTIVGHMWAVLGAVNAIFSSQQITQ